MEAFAHAFAPGAGAALVIKHLNGQPTPRRSSGCGRPRRGTRTSTCARTSCPRPNATALVAASDCYVSLHRSEGFGHVLGEAMYLGRPVIATAYGGNLDFMDEDNSWLIPHGRSAVGGPGIPYPAHGTWAEPDLDAAARALRAAADDPAATRARGRRAAADVRRTHGLAVVGAELGERIRALAGRAADPAEAKLGVADWWRNGDAATRGASRGGLRGAARGALMRALGPYAAHQRTVDGAIVDAGRTTLARVQNLERAHAEALAEVRRLRAQLDERAPTAPGAESNGAPARHADEPAAFDA